MNLFKLFITLFCLFTSWGTRCHASSEVSTLQDEIVIMDHLIQATEQNLEDQKKIYSLIQSYHAARAQFMENETQEIGVELLSCSVEILDLLEQKRLISYFKKEFIEELQFFSSILTNKNRLSAP